LASVVDLKWIYLVSVLTFVAGLGLVRLSWRYERMANG
jgi:hypothetical protein